MESTTPLMHSKNVIEVEALIHHDTYDHIEMAIMPIIKLWLERESVSA